MKTLENKLHILVEKEENFELGLGGYRYKNVPSMKFAVALDRFPSTFL